MSNIHSSKQSKKDVNVGDVFIRWTVIAQGRDKGGRDAPQCRCECGSIGNVRKAKLLAGNSRSCGCLRDEELTKHGMTTRASLESSNEYWVWNAMVQRCTNPNDRGYKNYGGRGITVHPEWLTFKGFYRDMGARPGKGYSIEREDNNKAYGPDNCKWVTRAEQNRNKRNNFFITFNGEKKCLPEWGREKGMSPTTIRQRLSKGWSIEEALNTPLYSTYRKVKELKEEARQ